MTAFASLILMVAAAMGWGGLVLAGLGARPHLPAAERPVWALVLGMGVIGWLLFFPGLVGLLTPLSAGIVCAIGLPGLWLLRPGLSGSLSRPCGVEWALLAALAVVMGLNLLQALSPPADADSMAYHFANIRDILRTGHLPFVARAVDGAIPQLLHLTYLPALGLGSERGLTLWCMASGWAVALLTFVLARRVLARPWALAVALVLMTTPAMVYGAGTGQMEARLAALVLGALFAAAAARRDEAALPMALLSGLLAGFAAGAKVTGLLPLGVCGLVVISRRGGLKPALAYGLAGLAAGAQWYGWNWWNSGDPVFPILWPLLHYDNGLWNQAQQSFFTSIMAESEILLPRTPFWWAAYPFYASVIDHPTFESGRTGLGPLPLLLPPFALAGCWLKRRQLSASALLPVVLGLVGIYSLWFLLGPSQRLRHLLPLLAPALIVMTAAAQRSSLVLPGLRTPLMAAFAVTLAVQISGTGVFSVKFLRGLGQDRDTFLSHNVAGYDAVRWINANLPANARIGTLERQILYLMDPPSFLLHPVYQAQVDLRPEAMDERRFAQQLAAVGVTHVLYAQALPQYEVPPVQVMSESLIRQGCASLVRYFPLIRLGSRSLPGLSEAKGEMALIALNPGCS